MNKQVREVLEKEVRLWNLENPNYRYPNLNDKNLHSYALGADVVQETLLEKWDHWDTFETVVKLPFTEKYIKLHTYSVHDESEPQHDPNDMELVKPVEKTIIVYE